MNKSLLYFLLVGIALTGTGCFQKSDQSAKRAYSRTTKKNIKQKQLDEDIEEFELMDDIDENFFIDHPEAKNPTLEEENLSWMDLESTHANHEILFDFNRAGIRKDQHKHLESSIKWAKESAKKGHKVVVEGHADAIGARDYNLALSEHRAKTIADKLQTAGVAKNKLVVVGRGQEIQKVHAPLTPAAQQPNRRAVLYEVSS